MASAVEQKLLDHHFECAVRALKYPAKPLLASEPSSLDILRLRQTFEQDRGEGQRMVLQMQARQSIEHAQALQRRVRKTTTRSAICHTVLAAMTFAVVMQLNGVAAYLCMGLNLLGGFMLMLSRAAAHEQITRVVSQAEAELSAALRPSSSAGGSPVHPEGLWRLLTDLPNPLLRHLYREAEWGDLADDEKETIKILARDLVVRVSAKSPPRTL